MDPDGDRALLESLPPAPPEVTVLPASAQAGLWLLLACKQGELCWAGGPAHLPCPWCPRENWRGAPCPWERLCCASPPILPGKEKLFPGEEEPSSFWEKSSEARHESELVQLSTQVTVERLNMDKCCRFIHNVSFYLWNVSEWSKDTKNVVSNCS